MNTFTIINHQTKLQPKNSRRRLVRRVAKWLLYSLAGLVVLLMAALIIFRWQASLRETQTGFEAAPPTGRFVEAGDAQIFIQEMGPEDGPAVLFIHGTGAWSEIWRKPMEVLAQAGFHAIALDLPPFGFSERPDDATYGRVEQARRIIGVLDALDISGVTLVGHSFGAGPTVEATLLASERVQALVLVDAALGLQLNGEQQRGRSPVLNTLLAADPLRNAIISATATNPRLSKRLLQTLILDPADATDEQVAMLQQQLVVKGSTDALGKWLLDFLNPQQSALSSNQDIYKTLNMPVLIIWGDSDTIVPISHAEYLERQIPEAELVILKQVGHIPHIEDVDLFNEALLKFLSNKATGTE